MAPNQFAFTMRIAKQIQDINGNHGLSAEEKRDAINQLSGAKKEDMYQYLNDNFRTGPTLAASLRKFVSKDRPRGAVGVRGLIERRREDK